MIRIIKFFINPTLLKFIINGLFATGIHYVTLYVFLYILSFSPFGADLIAATIGMIVSFIGNKYFVFKNKEGKLHTQAFKFLVIYGIIALFHAAILHVSIVILQINYNYGFFIATSIQVILSYIGNKKVVFYEKNS